MDITNCTKIDFDQILCDIVEFWGNDRTFQIHHPMFVNEFVNSAFVIKDQDLVAAYLFGFLSQTAPIGYVHLIGVRNSYLRQGLGKRLYLRFIDYAKAHGCREIKAITSPTNLISIAFHQSLGMTLIGDAEYNGMPIVEDYSGPGQHRVVFEKLI